MAPGKKLAIGGVVIAGVTLYMAYLGAAASWQYYLTADECLADPAGFLGKRLRVSGRVAAGSLSTSEDRMRADFVLQGREGQLDVTCSGPLPDKAVPPRLSHALSQKIAGRVERILK